jgi:hypothetical protein
MMKIAFLVVSLLLAGTFAAQAQDSTKVKKPKTSLADKIEKLPDMFIPEVHNPTDSALSILKNENLILIINPEWNEKGTQTNNDLKITKLNEDPLKETFPLPEKEIANVLVITMTTIKKSAEDKKNSLLTAAKQHLAAYYKEAGKAISADELTTNAKYFTSGPEAFTTAQGKQGELNYINDIAPQQSTYIVLFTTPGAKPGTTVFVQFSYIKYTYESVVPDDFTELRQFVYPDDQKTYQDFTKRFIKTLKIQ